MELNPSIELVGVYNVSELSNIHLVELIVVNIAPKSINIHSFTQEDKMLSKDNWQVAYDEHYLNLQGDRVIGRFGEQNNLQLENNTRIAFFMYYIDFNKPLLSQYGEIILTNPINIPERLLKIIDFEAID